MCHARREAEQIIGIESSNQWVHIEKENLRKSSSLAEGKEEGGNVTRFKESGKESCSCQIECKTLSLEDVNCAELYHSQQVYLCRRSANNNM